MSRPDGVTAIAIIFLVSGLYLLGLAVLFHFAPDRVLTVDTVWLLNGLRLALPFPFPVAAIIHLYLGWGLLHMGKWARAVAIVVAGLGFISLVPAVSAAAIAARIDLLWSGLHMIFRVVILWYLFQPAVRDWFERTGPPPNLSLH